MNLDDILQDTSISMDVVIDIVENDYHISSCLAESLKNYSEGNTLGSVSKFREAMNLMSAYAAAMKLTQVGNRKLLRP